MLCTYNDINGGCVYFTWTILSTIICLFYFIPFYFFSFFGNVYTKFNFNVCSKSLYCLLIYRRIFVFWFSNFVWTFMKLKFSEIMINDKEKYFTNRVFVDFSCYLVLFEIREWLLSFYLYVTCVKWIWHFSRKVQAKVSFFYWRENSCNGST